MTARSWPPVPGPASRRRRRAHVTFQRFFHCCQHALADGSLGAGQPNRTSDPTIHCRLHPQLPAFGRSQWWFSSLIGACETVHEPAVSVSTEQQHSVCIDESAWVMAAWADEALAVGKQELYVHPATEHDTQYNSGNSIHASALHHHYVQDDVHCAAPQYQAGVSGHFSSSSSEGQRMQQRHGQHSTIMAAEMVPNGYPMEGGANGGHFTAEVDSKEPQVCRPLLNSPFAHDRHTCLCDVGERLVESVRLSGSLRSCCICLFMRMWCRSRGQEFSCKDGLHGGKKDLMRSHSQPADSRAVVSCPREPDP